MMKKEAAPVIIAVIFLLITPVIASAMSNIQAAPKKDTPTPKQEATQTRSVQTPGEKAKVQSAIKKDSNKKENPGSK